jgi:uncharacterized membrane protein
VRNEEGSLRHASEHSSDPMAICAHFLTTRMLVTGIAHFLSTHTLSLTGIAHFASTRMLLTGIAEFLTTRTLFHDAHACHRNCRLYTND